MVGKFVGQTWNNCKEGTTTRLPADFDWYKSDGRAIEIDLHDPSINELRELDGEGDGGTDTARRLVEWLRSITWTVSTEHRGPMRVGERTGRQDKSVARLELRLLDEVLHSNCVYWHLDSALLRTVL